MPPLLYRLAAKPEPAPHASPHNGKVVILRIIQLMVVVKGKLQLFLHFFLYIHYGRLYNEANNPPDGDRLYGGGGQRLRAAPGRKGAARMFSEQLKMLRRKKGLSQGALSAQLGVTQQAVGKWETGRSTPDPATVARLAELLDTTADILLGVAPAQAPRQSFGGPVGSYAESPVPVVGTVRAGYGALAFEEDYGVEMASVKDPDNYFYLIVKGDSMEPRIHDGDYALVRRQPTLSNGELGVMVFGEGEGTLKRYLQRGNAVVLQPFNPAYDELIIRGEELEDLYIVGKVVETKTKW